MDDGAGIGVIQFLSVLLLGDPVVGRYYEPILPAEVNCDSQLLSKTGVLYRCISDRYEHNTYYFIGSTFSPFLKMLDFGVDLRGTNLRDSSLALRMT
jgi:hypothetical protein